MTVYMYTHITCDHNVCKSAHIPAFDHLMVQTLILMLATVPRYIRPNFCISCGLASRAFLHFPSSISLPLRECLAHTNQCMCMLLCFYVGMYIEGDGGRGSSSECGEEVTGESRTGTHLGFFESVPDDKEILKHPPVRVNFKELQITLKCIQVVIHIFFLTSLASYDIIWSMSRLLQKELKKDGMRSKPSGDFQHPAYSPMSGNHVCILVCA